MKRNNLYIGVAAAALLLGAGAAFGAPVDVTQDVTNDASVLNTGTISLEATIGAGASASIGANGAIASVSVSGINGGFDTTVGKDTVKDFLGPVDAFGAIGQTATNIGNVSNPADTDPNSIVVKGADLGVGASVSVRAGGATAATAISGIADESNFGLAYTLPAIGPINQIATNSGSVTNNGQIDAVGALAPGASVSIGATGAAAATSLSFVNSSVSLDVGAKKSGIGDITQAVSNVPVDGADPLPEIINNGTMNVTGGLGRGASASISATGAVASVSFSAIADSKPTDGKDALVAIPGIGKITQGTDGAEITNAMDVTNAGSITGPVGALAEGASVSIAATGAAAAVSINTITVGGLKGAAVGNIGQAVTNSGAVTNTVTDDLTVGALADGASVSFSASGAVASVGATFNGSSWASETGSPAVGMSFGNVTQVVTNSGEISNNSGGSSINAGTLDGKGASVSIGATGAAAAVSHTSIAGANANPGATFGSITQTVTNQNTGSVTNTGSITATNISGTGASAAISATGAAASVSYASIADSAAMRAPTTGAITQTVTNSAPVTNTGTITITNGLGAGASASISAVGAASAVSFSSVR